MARVRSIITTALAGTLALLAAFFVVFNSIFSDIFHFSSHLVLLGYTIIIYAIFGILFSFVAPDLWHRWVHVFSWPAIVIVVLFSLNEFSSRIILHLTYANAAAIGVALGAWAGLMIRRRKIKDDSQMLRAKRMMPKLLGVMISLFVIGVVVSSQIKL